MLSPGDVDFLEAVLAGLAELETRWSGIEEICASAPTTLVHGDFNSKNMRLRQAANGTTVVVFDWDDAGWGVPAVDLAQQALPASNLSANPDLFTYRSTVQERWPHMSSEAWLRLAYCGSVLRSLAALYWEARSLRTEWASMAVDNIRLYEAERTHALARIGLDGDSVLPHGRSGLPVAEAVRS